MTENVIAVVPVVQCGVLASRARHCGNAGAAAACRNRPSSASERGRWLSPMAGGEPPSPSEAGSES